ncbi:hypothetical protein HYDPIDRAFT_108414 [Hydnomerulius pinastri MD-312]|nr:hypothetical protein HYDPIDRAFT_108414 [Hydnomerulius pinastri MD-312]
MTGVNSSRLPFSTGTASIRRKPATTYQSPAAHISALHLEKPFTSSSRVTSSPHGSSPAPKSTLGQPPVPSSKPELPQRLTFSHKPHHHRIPPLLPLYHPLGELALSLPDLDPTVFGLPAPVAIFDDPTRRSSNRTRRPAAKVRDADAATPPQPPFVDVTPTPDAEPKDKPSPRKRRPAGGGGGGGSKRKRKEVDDGDASYPAKRSRNPRSSGVASATAAARTPSAEEVSPPASVGHTGASPAGEGVQGDPAEEKRPERRTTRSRGAIARRDSTASEATVTSVSVSIAATNAFAAQSVSNGDGMNVEGPTPNESSTEATSAPEINSGGTDSETPVPQEP